MFGNLRSAFEATEIDREQQLRAEVARVWENLGHQPSRAEMAKYGTVTVNTVEHYLERWENICNEVAQASDLPTGDKSTPTPSAEPSSDDGDSDGILETVKKDIDPDDE